MQKQIMAMIVAVMAVSLTGFAYAQTETPTQEDTLVLIILVAAVIGGFTLPIIAYATNGGTEPFNWRQYALSVIIVIPATVTITLGELEIFDPSKIEGLQGQVVLFLTVFSNSIASQFGKQTIQKGLSNRLKSNK